jgi:hypothetical protein
MSKAEEITRNNVAIGCPVGTIDNTREAVNEALEWAAQQCDEMESIGKTAWKPCAGKTAARCLAALIREGKAMG